MSVSKLIEDLYDIYVNEEYWHKTKLSKNDFFRYTEEGLKRNFIKVDLVGDIIIGYMEVWKINFHQFGCIICGEQFSPLDQDVSRGTIGYLANIYIKPGFRKSYTINKFKKTFFDMTHDCDYFVGEARRKSCAPVKVFKKSEILSLVK